MQFYTLSVKCSDFVFQKFRIIESNTLAEIMEILSQPFPSYIDGTIYLPPDENINIPQDSLQKTVKQPLDWLSINHNGIILNIEKHTKANERIILHPGTISIIALKKGLSDKYTLSTGNEIMHKKFIFPNKIF